MKEAWTPSQEEALKALKEAEEIFESIQNHDYCQEHVPSYRYDQIESWLKKWGKNG